MANSCYRLQLEFTIASYGSLDTVDREYNT